MQKIGIVALFFLFSCTSNNKTIHLTNMFLGHAAHVPGSENISNDCFAGLIQVWMDADFTPADINFVRNVAIANY